MKNKTRSDQPCRFFKSKDDTGYFRGELKYVFQDARLWSGKKRQIEKAVNRSEGDEATLIVLIKAFRLCWPNGYNGTPLFSAELREETVVQVIKYLVRNYGMDVIRVPWIEEKEIKERFARRHQVSDKSLALPMAYPELLDEVGIAVCAFLRFWHTQARNGHFSARKESAGRLKSIWQASIPPAQGKRKKTFDPFEVNLFYIKQLYLLYHIQNALRATRGLKTEKLKAASINFGLSVEVIQDFWGLDSKGQIERLSGPFPIKQMATELTARHFGITHQTVSNLRSKISR